jgi:hypothetical protein
MAAEQKKRAREIVAERLRRYYAEQCAVCSDAEDFLKRAFQRKPRDDPDKIGK